MRVHLNSSSGPLPSACCGLLRLRTASRRGRSQAACPPRRRRRRKPMTTTMTKRWRMARLRTAA
eukprot:14281689-Alexandrium_andersonii.AAC.1